MFKQDKKRTVMVVCGLLAAVAFVALMVGVYGRYVSGKDGQGTVKAEIFGFTSDYLSAAHPVYTIPAGNGTSTTVPVELRNRINELLPSDMDMEYKVYINKEEDELLAGQLDKGAVGKVNLVLNHDDGEEIEGTGKLQFEVKVVGTSNVGKDYGYTATLYATFILEPASESIYWNLNTISDSHYVVATVWTHGVEGALTIAVPDELIPDKTDPVMKDLSTGADVTGYTLEAWHSRSFRFFKPSPAAVSHNDFKVTVGGKDAVHVDPIP